MRWTAAALALIALSTAPHAQETASDVDSFRSLAAIIPQDPTITSEWTRLLPTIARQCEMTVDRERVLAIKNRSPTLPAVDPYRHRLDNRLKAAWDGMAGRDLDEACRTADGLWGESGGSLPGVLRDKEEGALPTASSLALAAFVL